MILDFMHYDLEQRVFVVTLEDYDMDTRIVDFKEELLREDVKKLSDALGGEVSMIIHCGGEDYTVKVGDKFIKTSAINDHIDRILKICEQAS